MKYDLILHIGANKTGSSAIQYFIRRNVAAIRAAGYAIPDRELGWSAKITGEHVFSTQQFFNDKSNPRAIDAKFDEMMATKPSDSTVLISGENLSNFSNYDFFDEICRKYKTRVILYIRRQDDLLLSSWQQWYSKIETDLHAWLIRALPLIGNWEATIDGWEKVAGAGSVDVRLFERDQFPGGNIAADFGAALGVAPDAEEVDYSAPNINPSFNDFIVPLVSGNRDMFRDVNDNAFYHYLEQLTGTKYTKGKKVSLISPAHRDSILSYYDQQNRRLCKRFFPGRRHLFKPVDHSSYEYLSREALVERQLQFLTHVVYKMGEKIKALGGK